MTEAVAGVDVGGTKTRMRLVDVRTGEVLADRTVPSSGWQTASLPQAAAWLAERLQPLLGSGHAVRHVAVGAHGCETPGHCDHLARELGQVLGVASTVVNDAELLVPAAGLAGGVGVVSGTGAIAVGRHRDTGAYLSAGGWGWVLGDEGSGSAIVRDAARAVLSQADAGTPGDGLEDALLRAFGVPGLPELAAVMSWNGGVETWGAHVPAVFAAAEAGSETAGDVIRAGGRSLARLVGQLARRGAEVGAVVVAGGVITGQPRLLAAFEAELASLLPGVTTTLLQAPPVEGAVELARRTRN
ncbi:BadF/BadG/BcrA/BcrD ATPase family protein [Planotetraspora phitsanulokensis]|uniref:ATPase n=1 Tax=Planotetraspora phitsanulokensis TaxID=575192 RepID=A0A8J3XL51_9ACTN|nr:BadF/BadG/BcrA/BcrD ATPase family protein [Planotetraspora phitsanulokensis]GII40308.1 ATPase [Planotetraspora phitsanulokensis]